MILDRQGTEFIQRLFNPLHLRSPGSANPFKQERLKEICGVTVCLKKENRSKFSIRTDFVSKCGSVDCCSLQSLCRSNYNPGLGINVGRVTVPFEFAVQSTTGMTMTDLDQESASVSESSLGNDLPPVQPPSAGFIVQLFIFPAMIVMAVVAIWWMFGLIAVGEQDWHKLLQELQSQNLHIRNRAMYGLAQVLEQDERLGSQGHQLTSNREIAQGLADQLATELRKNSTSKEGVAIQVYLTRALARVDSFDITQPVLIMALEPTRDSEVREIAIYTLSIVAGRATQRGETLNSTEATAALVQLSADPLPVLRQSAAYALGLFGSTEALHQLAVLLQDGDEKTRVNAAIGLARHGMTDGFPVFISSLKLPDSTTVPTDPVQRDVRLSADAEQFLVVKNCLKAVGDLAGKFDAKQRQELIPLVEQLSSKHPENRIQVDATSALIELKQQ